MNISTCNLKKIPLALGLVYGLLAAQQSFAEECQVNLSESVVDLGQLSHPGSRDAPSPGNLYALDERTLSLNATCPGATKLMLLLQGDTLGDKFRFARRGQVSVTLSNALLDGRNVDLARVKDTAVPDVFGPSIVAVPGDRVIPVSAGLPAQGSNLSVQIEIRPLVPVAELSSSEAKTLESNVSFEVRGR